MPGLGLCIGPRTYRRQTPYLVPGLAVDLNADGLLATLADAAAVTTWTDATYGGNDIGNTGANRPTFDASNPQFNGHASVNFAKASTQYLFGADLPVCTALSGSDKPLTVFAVVRRSTKISADEYVFTLGNSAQAAQSYLSGGYRYQNSNSQRGNSDVRDDAGTAATISTGQNEITDLAPQVLCWTFTGTQANIYVVGGSQNPTYDAGVNSNGAASDYSAQGAITFDQFSIGAQYRATTASRPCDMEVARVLVYTRELSTAERVRVSRHLWQRYCQRTIDDPTDLAGCSHWWDGNQISGDFGGDVDTWEDQVGALDFSATGFDSPILAAHDNGKKTVLFRGTDDAMDSAAASDGNFLHDGSNSTLAVVYRVESTDESLQPILDTNGGSTTARGFSIAHDGASAAHSLQIKIGNGTTNVVNHDSQDYGSRPGAWHTAIVVHQASVPSSEENYHVWLDGEHYVASDAANAESASDAAGAITLGKLAGAGTYGKLQIAEIVAFDRALGAPGEIQLLNEYLAAKWQTSHVAVVAGNGLSGILNDATPHRGFPGLLQTASGKWLCAYRRAADHGSSAGVCCIKTSTDGYRWSDERVIFDDSANYDWRGVNYIGQISSGRIFVGMNLSETDSGLLPYTASIIYSDDDGNTWSGPVFLSNATDSWFASIFGGTLTNDEGVNAIVELADGTLLAHFMALVDSAVRTHIVQCRSTDGGTTWTEPTIVYYGRGPGLGDFPQDERIQEPVVVRFADGELLMAIRADTPNERIYFARSTDDGASWSPSAFTTEYVAGWGNPRMIVDPNDADGVFLFHRLNTSPNLAVWRHSGDRGATWTDPQPLTNFNDSATTTLPDYAGMTYAYPAIDSSGNVWLALGMESGDDGDVFVRLWEVATA